jgi:hypothetical protein
MQTLARKILLDWNVSFTRISLDKHKTIHLKDIGQMSKTLLKFLKIDKLANIDGCHCNTCSVAAIATLVECAYMSLLKLSLNFSFFC